MLPLPLLTLLLLLLLAATTVLFIHSHSVPYLTLTPRHQEQTKPGPPQEGMTLGMSEEGQKRNGGAKMEKRKRKKHGRLYLIEPEHPPQTRIPTTQKNCPMCKKRKVDNGRMDESFLVLQKP